MSALTEELTAWQPHIWRLLQRAVTQQRVAHAYLFEGPKGAGKAAYGQLLAKLLLCSSISEDGMPCNHCTDCKRIASGNHPNVFSVAPDGLSIKKEQIQLLQTELKKRAFEEKPKVYILHAADKMTSQAANSLLKFLEDPPSDTHAILLTEQKNHLLLTIQSRLQQLNFRPLPKASLQNQLQEADLPAHIVPLLVEITQNVEEAKALYADDWFVQARKKVLHLTQVLKKDTFDTFVWLQTDWNSHFTERDEVDRGLDLLLFWYRDLRNMQMGAEDGFTYPDYKDQLQKEALRFSHIQWVHCTEAILEAKRRLQRNAHPHSIMEHLVLSLEEGIRHA
ncbi:DNA polymerase III subunit delta' [Bacillus fonticola]|uniref:DNA polymerase III subunit delta' n=1 Tax=Bacillus fonticola TaxID=2728853 RepID=UPI0014745475|nr:DNA polymerase III subunit delta' [Bacillus fonticola]